MQDPYEENFTPPHECKGTLKWQQHVLFLDIKIQ